MAHGAGAQGLVTTGVESILKVQGGHQDACLSPAAALAAMSPEEQAPALAAMSREDRAAALTAMSTEDRTAECAPH